jgi:hypothetical protein
MRDCGGGFQNKQSNYWRRRRARNGAPISTIELKEPAAALRLSGCPSINPRPCTRRSDARATNEQGTAMRVMLAIAASVCVLAADGSASAASCGKGMLWPYVRNPGDCLTDAELKAGQTGTYSGPVNTNPDISGIQAPAPVQTPAQAPAPRAPVAGSSAPAPSNNSAARSPNGVKAVTESVPRNDVSCHKGVLWPFSRSPGDCLTDVEKKNGQTGVFRADAVVTQASATVAAGGATASPGANNAGGANTGGANTTGAPTATASNDTNTAPPVQTCSKGALWPFVRHPGDCPTDAEKRRGK